MRFRLALLAAVVIASSPAAAWAGDEAAAQVLFAEAKKAAAAGDYKSACPKFEESQRLDAGMGTLYNLADCYEHVGRLASAWGAFLDVAAQAKAAGQSARVTDANSRASAIEPRLSRLTIVVSNPGLPGLSVTRDGVALGAASFGIAVPVDGGDHTVVAAAPGKKQVEGHVVVQGEHANAVFELPSLEDAPATPPPTTAPTTGSNLTEPNPSDEDAARSRRKRLTFAAIAGAVGVVGVGVGGAFGLVSLSKHNDAKSQCGADGFCNADGVVLRAGARNAGNVSTVGFAVGGAGLLAGAILWLTAPSGERARSEQGALRWAPTWGPGQFGVAADGRF